MRRDSGSGCGCCTMEAAIVIVVMVMVMVMVMEVTQMGKKKKWEMKIWTGGRTDRSRGTLFHVDPK